MYITVRIHGPNEIRCVQRTVPASQSEEASLVLLLRPLTAYRSLFRLFVPHKYDVCKTQQDHFELLRRCLDNIFDNHIRIIQTY